MCFGGSKETGTKDTTKTNTIPSWLSGASAGNIDWLNNLRNQGYQSYTGDRVANLTPDEQAANQMVRDTAGTTNKYLPETETAYRNATNTPADQVSTIRSIDDVNGAGGSTADYMDPYLRQVLDPMLQQITEDTAKQRNQEGAAAAMAGAFGDSSHGFENARIADLGQRTKLSAIGNTYSQAYNNALAQKQADIARYLDVAKTNASLKETGLQRALQGGAALTGLDKYQTDRSLNLANSLGKVGQGQRAIDQAKLDAAYQEFTNKTGYPLQVSKYIIDAINGSPSKGEGTQTGTETSYAPDNTGWGILASLFGTGAKALTYG